MPSLRARGMARPKATLLAEGSRRRRGLPRSGAIGGLQSHAILRPDADRMVLMSEATIPTADRGDAHGSPRHAARHPPRSSSRLLFVVMIGLSLWYLTRREPLVIQGEVQSRTFDMAARVDGRIGQIIVARSQDVPLGAPLIRIDNPELIAKERQSEAALRVAEAELARVRAGFRAETIATRKAEVERASADLTLAQKTFERTQATRGHARFAAIAVRQGQGRADARGTYAGPGALFLQRGGGRLHARGPEHRAGQGRERQGRCRDAQGAGRPDGCRCAGREPGVPHPGRGRRVRAAGRAADLAHRPADMWVQFDLREDLLRDLKQGSKFDVRVPALGDRVVELEVRVIAAKGEYTGWRATRASGDFDLRTFEIRAYPAQPVPGLRPGMSVYTDWAERRS